VGGLDNDIYIVDNAGDLVIENSGEGTDTIKTVLNAYTLNSDVDNLAYTGADSFGGTGNALANSIQSRSGNDTLDGGEGADTLTGGAGNDLYIVDNAGDAVVENSGNGIDTVETNLSTYVLAAQIEKLVYAGGGNFHATGNLLANDIAGAAGNDTINGGSGNDTINGGGGMDSLTGGVGNDVFVFHSGETNGDTIADFTSGVDRLQFAGFGPGSTLTQTNATDWVITDGVDHHAETIHVANHPVIHAGDFMFL